MDEVTTYAFGKGDAQAPVMLSGLERIGEKLGRRLRAVLEPMVGMRPYVHPLAVSVSDLSLWAGDVPTNSSIGVYRMLPLKGNVMLRFDAGMIATLVDCFYGGARNKAMPARHEFTPTEDRLIARLSQMIVEQVAGCWEDILPLDITLAAREAGAGFTSATPATDQVVIQRFKIGLIRNETWLIDLVFPLAALRAVEALTGSKVHDENVAVDQAWQTRMTRQMAHIRLPARTVLTRPSLSLAELIQLQPGDVIPVHINRSLPLLVGNRIVAHGSIGEQDGRAAFMIEKLN